MTAPLKPGITITENGHPSIKQDYVTVRIMDQLFGIPVLQVQDILRNQPITRIPLAPMEVAGALNLRGRIVTAIDVRTRLGLPLIEAGKKIMNVVVECDGELYSLRVDSVGEVLSLNTDIFEKNPATLKELWREISLGIYRLQDELLIILNIPQLLNFNRDAAA